LINEAGVDIVHGHSSHHPKGIEVYKNRPILYGCGDFLNDYEGISGYQEYRDDLTLMYFPRMDAASGKLVRFDRQHTLARQSCQPEAVAGAALLGRNLNYSGVILLSA
jgi:poly-gamma-glutamate capsule biosynthesis protein CapA/YwtB (metallophosphatase superfamily)